jgi:hypothetical protein
VHVLPSPESWSTVPGDVIAFLSARAEVGIRFDTDTVGIALAVFAALPGGWATIVAALIAATVALSSVAVAATNGRRDRRRNLYGEAYRTTMSWVEMAYRAYHAPAGDQAFLDGYHKLWEDLRYFEGWLIFESSELGYSFARFKDAVQRVCDGFIEEAWLERTDEAKPLTVLPVEASPQTYERQLNAFLQDAREHLSPYPWRRATMRRRVRARITSEGGAHASGLPRTTPVPETKEAAPASSRTRPADWSE